jgi:hypothetical protein
MERGGSGGRAGKYPIERAWVRFRRGKTNVMKRCCECVVPEVRTLTESMK